MWGDGATSEGQTLFIHHRTGRWLPALMCLYAQVAEGHRLLPPHVLPSFPPSFLPTDIQVPFLSQTCAMQQVFK